MKLLISITIALFVAHAAMADCELSDGVVWSYSIVDGDAYLYGMSSPAPVAEENDVLYIPSTLGGKPVVDIEGGITADWNTKLHIPASVTSVRHGAIANNSSYTYTNRLQWITVDAGNGYYKSIDGCLYTKDGRTFVRCPGGRLGRVVVAIGTQHIADNAFNGCFGVTEISLPNTVVSIGASACACACYRYSGNGSHYQTSLRSVNIPSSVRYIGNQAFGECRELDEDINIPDGVQRIGWQAFYNCSKIRSLTLPQSLVEIGYEAFKGCTQIRSYTLPKGFKIASSKFFDYAYNGAVTNCFYFLGEPPICFPYEKGVKVYYKQENTGAWQSVIPTSSEYFGGYMPYSLSYDGNGAESVVPSVSYPPVGSSIELPSLQKSGYAFLGWKYGYQTLLAGSEFVMPSADVTLVAQWARNVTVSFDANGGVVSPTSRAYQSNGVYDVLPEPYRTGYVFSGWSLVDSPGVYVLVNDSLATEKDHTLKANWTLAFHYVINDFERGTITLTGLVDAMPAGTFTIPAIYDGRRVTRVAEHAFQGLENLTKLIISEGIEELGSSAFYGCTKLTTVSLPSTLKTIRDNCFEDCSSLKTINLPEGLETVEHDFLNRTAVSALKIPSTLVNIEEGALAIPSGRTFTVAVGNPRYRVENDCIYDYIDNVVFMRANYSQKTFVIPEGATRISKCCFGDCDGGNITIPSTVTKIGESAFCGCNDLTVIFLGEEPSVENEECLFEDSTNVKVYVQPGQGWTGIPGTWHGVPIVYPAGAVAYWTERNDKEGGIVLRGISSGTPSGTLHIPSTYNGETVTAIGNIIYQNAKLTKVVFPPTIRRIIGSGIESCSALTEVVLNEGLEEIGEDAFLNCGITSFKIPSTVTSIGVGAFGQNPLKKIEVDSDNARYYVTANGLLIDGDSAKIQLSIRDQGALVIPEGIETIGPLAFEHVNLTSVKFPQTLREIEALGFCSEIGFSLTELDFSQTQLERVGSAAFICGPNLKTVRFPSTLQEIGYWTFNRCTALSSVYFAGGIPEITEDRWVVETAQKEMPKLWAAYPNGDIYIVGSDTTATRLGKVTTYVTPNNGWESVCKTGKWQERDVKMKTSVSVTVDGKGGTVLGGGAYDSGAKITLKATPAELYVFAGWYENDEPLTGIAVDYRTPSIAYTVPARNVEIVGRFVRAGSDEKVEMLLGMPEEIATGIPISPAVVDVSGCTSLPTVKISGLPTGLKFTAKALDVKDTRTKKTTHYEANTVYGTPTKSGVYTTTIMVTTAGRACVMISTFTVIDRAKGENILKIESDSAMGKVMGAGIYKAGAKVTLKATANAAKKATKTTPAQEATVFAGWFADEGFNDPLVGAVDYRTATFAHEMPNEDAAVYAKFVPASEDATIALYADGDEVTADAADTVFNTAGLLTLALEAESVTVPKIAISGLPAGLKFTDKQVLNKDKSVLAEANTIYGAATKPGTYVVTAKLTNTTVKKAIEKKFTIVVDNLTAANDLLDVTDSDGNATPLQNARGEKYEMMEGVAENVLPVLTAADKGDKVSISGLPAGLKYDAKSGKILGIVTKAGTYVVYVTVSSGKVSRISTFTVLVAPLPTWAVGTFTGYGENSYGELGERGQEGVYVTATVSGKGAVTMKSMWNDGSTSTIQSQLVRSDAEGVHFEVNIDRKHSEGDRVHVVSTRALIQPVEYAVGVTNSVLELEMGAEPDDSEYPNQFVTSCCRNNWKDKGAVLPRLDTKTVKWLDLDDGASLSIKLAASGAATVTYWNRTATKATASGSGQLALLSYDPDLGWFGKLTVIAIKAHFVAEYEVQVALDGELTFVGMEEGLARPYSWFAGTYSGVLHEVDCFPGCYVIVKGKKYDNEYSFDYDVSIEVASNGKVTAVSTFGGQSTRTQSVAPTITSDRDSMTATGTFMMNGYKFYLTACTERNVGTLSVECNAADASSSVSVSGTLKK